MRQPGIIKLLILFINFVSLIENNNKYNAMFKKGESGNPFGRPQGISNKVTTEIREKINDFLGNNFDSIKTDINKLEPKDRIKFYIELLSFGLPKQRSFEMGIDFNTNPDFDADKLKEDELQSAITAIETLRMKKNTTSPLSE